MKVQDIARLMADAHRINSELAEMLIAGRDAHRDLGPLDLLLLKLGQNLFGDQSQWRAFRKLQLRPENVREKIDSTALYEGLAGAFDFLRIQIDRYQVCPRTKSDLATLALLQMPITTSYRLAVTASCSKATAHRWLETLRDADVVRRIKLNRTNHYVVKPVAVAVLSQLFEKPGSIEAIDSAEKLANSKSRLRLATGFHPAKRTQYSRYSYRDIPMGNPAW